MSLELDQTSERQKDPFALFMLSCGMVKNEHVWVCFVSDWSTSGILDWTSDSLGETARAFSRLLSSVPVADGKVEFSHLTFESDVDAPMNTALVFSDSPLGARGPTLAASAFEILSAMAGDEQIFRLGTRRATIEQAPEIGAKLFEAFLSRRASPKADEFIDSLVRVWESGLSSERRVTL